MGHRVIPLADLRPGMWVANFGLVVQIERKRNGDVVIRGAWFETQVTGGSTGVSIVEGDIADNGRAIKPTAPLSPNPPPPPPPPPSVEPAAPPRRRRWKFRQMSPTAPNQGGQR